KRPDLKVIITSATIDVERVSEHFGGAPVVEVSGRTYPVEVRYRPLREAADALRGRLGTEAEILPLSARLSSGEQQRVFRPGNGSRVVLATNVAETSLTVPGVRSVVDVGTARVSRYSARLKVQRLPI